MFDTLKYSRRLRDAGIPEAQAEAFASAHQEAIDEALDKQVAMKQDINDLRQEIAKVKGEQMLMKWMLVFNLVLSFTTLSLLATMLLRMN